MPYESIKIHPKNTQVYKPRKNIFLPGGLQPSSPISLLFGTNE